MTSYSRVVYPSFVDYKEEIISKDKQIKEKFQGNQVFRFKADLPLDCVAFSNDELFVVASYDKTIIVYDLVKKQRVLSADNTHKRELSALAISPDSKFLASGSKNGEIAIWDFTNLQRIKYFPDNHSESISSIKYTPDGKFLVSISQDGCINLWNISEDMSCESLKSKTSELKALTCTKDGRFIIIGGLSNIEIWDTKTKKVSHVFKNSHRGIIGAVTLSSDEKILVSCAEEVRVWDFQNREKIETLDSSRFGLFTSVAINKSSTVLAAGTRSGKIIFWNLKTKKVLYSMERSHEETILGLYFFKEDNNLISASRDKAIRIWSIDQDALVYKFNPEHNKISSVAISSDKNFVATGSFDRSIEIYDIHKKALRSRMKGPDSGLIQILFEAKRNRLVSLHSDRLIRIWDFDGNIFKTFDEPAYCIALAEHGTKLIAGGQRIMIYDLEIESETPTRTININYEVTDLLDIQVSSDCTHVVAINNRNVFVWDYTLGEIIATFARAHEEDIRKVAITPDNSIVVTAGQVIKIWSLSKQECISVLENVNNTEITGLAFSGGGKFIIAGRSDGSIEVWDWKLKRLVHLYKTSAPQNNSVFVLSEDQSYIVSAIQTEVSVYQNLFIAEEVLVSAGAYSNIDMKSRLGIFVLDGFLDLRGRNHRAELINNYPELFVYPFEWNLLHLSAIYFPDPKTIRACIDHGVPLTLDSDGMTPIHHLLKKEKLDFELINTLLNNFDKLAPIDDEFRLHKIMDSFSPIILKLLNLNTPAVANLLKYMVGNPLTVKNNDIPRFGVHVKGKAQHWSVVTSPYFSEEVRESNVVHGPNPITVKMLRLKMDYDHLSEDMLKLGYTLEKINEEEIFKSSLVSLLVDYLWESNKRTHRILALLYTVHIVLLSIWAGNSTGNLPGLSVTSFLFGLFFFFYEFIQFSLLGVLDYCGNLWNIFDLSRNILLIVTYIFCWTNVNNFESGENSEQTNTVVAREWLVSLLIVSGYIKWVKMLCFIKQIRRVVRISYEAFIDLLGWGMIVILTLFCFAVVFWQWGYITNWGYLIDYVYNVLYFHYDSSFMVRDERVFFVIFTVLLLIVLVNVLIALVIDTMNRVQHESIVVDSKEKLRMAVQSIIAKQNLRSCHFFRKSENINQGYLLYVGQHTEDYIKTQWRGISGLSKDQGPAQQKVSSNMKEEMSGLVETELSKFKESIRRQIKSIADNGKETRDDLKLLLDSMGVQAPKTSAKGDYTPKSVSKRGKKSEYNLDKQADGEDIPLTGNIQLPKPEDLPVSKKNVASTEPTNRTNPTNNDPFAQFENEFVQLNQGNNNS